MYCGQLTEPERADIRTEFENGKSRISLQLKMKIDCWRFLLLKHRGGVGTFVFGGKDALDAAF
jgi:hypothetical protein